jgi:hypothetical protein
MKLLFLCPTLLISHSKRLVLAAALIALACLLSRTPAFAVERNFAVGAGDWLPGKTSTIDNNFLQADGNGIRRAACL